MFKSVPAPHSGGPPFSEAKKILYKGLVVRVSASYRPSSKVVGCGEGSGERAARYTNCYVCMYVCMYISVQ